MIDGYVNDINTGTRGYGGCDPCILGDRGRQKPMSVGSCAWQHI